MNQIQKEVLEMLNSMSNEAVEELLAVLQEKKNQESECDNESLSLNIAHCNITILPTLISFVERFAMWKFGENPEWEIFLTNSKYYPTRDITFKLKPGMKAGTINVLFDSGKAYDLSPDAAVGFVLRHAPW